MTEPKRPAWEDELTETMLSEAMGRVTPPDLTARIARELAMDAPAAQGEDVSETAVRRRRLRPRGFLMLAAAGFLLAAGAAALFGAATPQAVVKVEVLAGRVAHVGAHGVRPLAGASDVLLRVGDRFATGATAASFRLVPLGVLQLHEETLVEVESMELSKRDGVLLMSSVTIGAVAGAFTWNTLAGSGTIEAGDSLRIVSADQDVGELSADQRALRERIAKLQNENERLRTALDRKALAETEEGKAEPGAPKSAAMAPMFTSEKYADVLGKVDWALMGGNMHKMVPLMAELSKYSDPTKAPPELLAEVQKLNAALVEQVGILMKGKVPGIGINGAFTHPIVAANQIGAALTAAGKDLTSDQREALERTMKFFAAKDDSLRRVEGEREYKLDNLIEALTFKQQFYDEATQVLTEEQRSALFAGETQGRFVYDLFGPGMMVPPFARPLKASNSQEYADKLCYALGVRMKTDKQTKAKVDAIVQEWSKSLPQEQWGEKAGEWNKTSQIREVAVRQKALMQRILQSVELPQAVREKMQASMYLFIPVPRQ